MSGCTALQTLICYNNQLTSLNVNGCDALYYLHCENNRLTSPRFLERYRKFLRPGGIIHLKTDSMFLHQYSKAVAEANNLQVIASAEDLYGSDRENLYNSSAVSVMGKDSVDALFSVQTYYEKMFLKQGLKITYLSFTIDHDGPFISPESFDADYWKKKETPRKTFGIQVEPISHASLGMRVPPSGWCSLCSPFP